MLGICKAKMLSDSSDPKGVPIMRPDGGESADSDDGENTELQERLAAVKIPSGEALPPPPDIHFERPSLGSGAPGRSFSKAKDASGSRYPIEEDKDLGSQPSHLGAGVVIGVTFPACIIVGVSIGHWIDHRWNPVGTPWGTIIMSIAGIAAGFMNIFRVVAMVDRGKAKSNKQGS